jgi:PemK-like, MazF-like toxin of type II toxin-antitoxin system
VLIELATPAGRQSGLQFDSVVNCVNLATLDESRVLRRLGDLTDAVMGAVHAALKSALAISPQLQSPDTFRIKRSQRSVWRPSKASAEVRCGRRRPGRFVSRRATENSFNFFQGHAVVDACGVGVIAMQMP